MGRSHVQSLSLVRGVGGLLLLSALLTACHQGGGTAVGKLTPDDTPNFESCDPKFVAETEELVRKGSGGGPLAGNALKTEFVESAFFQKPFDRYDLEAVLDIPTVSTAVYVKSLGITLHKIPRANMKGQCPMYFYLEKAPPVLQGVWNQAAGGNTGNGKLAGLFFEFCGAHPSLPACSERNMVNATILVDEASDRWTLVHEMMHYNFNQGRKASTTLPPGSWLERAAKGYANDMKTSWEAFLKLPNRGDLTNSIAAYRKVVEIGREIFVRRALEEVAIEGMLIDLWSKDRLGKVSSRAPASGVWYMGFSRDQFIPTLDPLDEVGVSLKKAADENFWPEISAEVDAIKTLIESYRTETQAMIDDAKAKIKAKQPSQTDESFTQPFLTFFSEKVEPDFNVVTFEADARAHLASHDEGGVQASFEKTTRDLARAIR